MPIDLQMAVIWYIVFIFSLVLHEAAHAWSGLRLGDSTAYAGGQVTLNPLPHIKREPVGTVVVPIAAYFLMGWMIGWASAPYNVNWARSHPRKSALVALAGPLSNLLLVILAIVIIRVGFYAGWFYAPDSIGFSHIADPASPGLAFATSFLSILFSLNLILFLFNLLPMPGFDGSYVLFLFLSRSYIDEIFDYISNPASPFISIFIAWYVFDWVFDPVHTLFINFLFPGIVYG